MASFIAADSSCIVGMKRNRTESGIVICRPMCIRPSAVMHSLAVVDLMMYVGFALLFVGGILGALLGHKMLKKHFGRAGIV